MAFHDNFSKKKPSSDRFFSQDRNDRPARPAGDKPGDRAFGERKPQSRNAPGRFGGENAGFQGRTDRYNSQSGQERREQGSFSPRGAQDRSGFQGKPGRFDNKGPQGRFTPQGRPGRFNPGSGQDRYTPPNGPRFNNRFGPQNEGSEGEGFVRPQPQRQDGSFDNQRQRPAPYSESQADFVNPLSETERDENLLSGRNPIREALKSGRDIEKILIQDGDLSGSAREIVAMARDAGIRMQTVGKNVLDRMATNHQGMVAYASAYAYSTVDEMLALAKEKNENPFLVILDQITDPHNLGAIIRTAACCGAHGVIIPLHRAVGLTSTAVKASAGAIEHIKVAKVVSLPQTIKNLKKQGVWLYAADMEGKDYRKVDFAGGCALVVGSEGSGISKLVHELCDVSVSIPMSGNIASLNASVAAGILLHAVFVGKNV